jgi:hypothetical protein
MPVLTLFTKEDCCLCDEALGNMANLIDSDNIFCCLSLGVIVEITVLFFSVSDPHRFYADPDPAFLLNADPDPDPGPDPTFRI